MQEYSFQKDKKSALYLLEGLAILIVIAEIFYSSLLAVIVLLPLLIPIFSRRRRKEEMRRSRELVSQFKECSNSILTALKAGKSAENAFRDAVQEMKFLYGDRSEICKELRQIVRGLDNNVPLENLLADFGERSKAEEIRDFAEVFSIAKRSGGNMTEILGRTITQIQNRIDVEREISVMISNSQLEQSIMDIVPFAIIAYIRLSSEGFMDVLYGNAAGILIMTVCLAVYLVAFVISEKIVDIRV